MRKIDETKREMYAKRFFNHFRGQFAQLGDDKSTFEITRVEFAEFIFRNGWLPDDWTYIPANDEPEKWVYLRNVINMIRTEMNAAAHLGLHGEPPFEARAKRGHSGNIVVHNLASLAVVTYTEVGKAMKVFIDNKTIDNKRRHAFLLDNLDRLPATLQHRVSSAESLYRIVATQLTAGLDSYITEMNNMYEDAYNILQLENTSEAP